MRDATGRYNSVLVLGGSSDLGVATARALVAQGTREVILAGRRPDALDAAAATLRGAGATVHTSPFHAEDPDSHAHALDALWPATDVDVALVAFGDLGDETYMADHPEAAARLVGVNLAGAASATLELVRRMEQQGHGTIVIFSSVASQRARADNAVYAASKAGLDALAQGLQDRLVGTGVHLMIVRPGFVHTKMTEGLKPAPFSTTADKVADDIVAGLASDASVVWSPRVLRLLFTALKTLPRPVWRKVSAR
jgi:decaprenylphospho-beta-D-erythro-pentofuranosid-2-ulose 2-reductase